MNYISRRHENARLTLQQRQLELRIARFLSGGVSLKNGPTREYLDAQVSLKSQCVKDALDELWEVQRCRYHNGLWYAHCDDIVFGPFRSNRVARFVVQRHEIWESRR
jgi:hypothetical protein